MMLCVQFILQTITTIHELCHLFNKTRSKVQKSYNLILLFVIKLIKYLVFCDKCLVAICFVFPYQDILNISGIGET